MQSKTLLMKRVGGSWVSVCLVPSLCVPFYLKNKKKPNKLSEKEEILLDVTSRLWFTYRKNFPAIGKSECILEAMLAHL